MATTTPALTTLVPMGYPAALQAIAAIEERIVFLRAIDAEAWSIADAHAALAALRTAFDLWPESVLDALHDATHRDLDELAEAEGLPDVPLAYTDRLDEYQTRGA